MWKHVTLVGALVAIIATVGMAAAPEANSGCAVGLRPLVNTPLGRFVGGEIGRLLLLRSELDLTDEQRGRICDVLASRRPQIVDTIKAVRAKRLALRDAVLNPQSSESDIRAAADELGDVIGDAAVKAAKLRSELAPILTEQQRQTIARFIAEHDDSVSRFLEKAGKAQ